MITSMDDEIGNILAALEKSNMRDNTLIVFMSDNGGNQSAMLAGDADVSKLKLPADTVHTGAARACCTRGARASWPSPTGPDASRLAR
jgi:arylsulfatase A-like enzyme